MSPFEGGRLIGFEETRQPGDEGPCAQSTASYPMRLHPPDCHFLRKPQSSPFKGGQQPPVICLMLLFTQQPYFPLIKCINPPPFLAPLKGFLTRPFKRCS